MSNFRSDISAKSNWIIRKGDSAKITGEYRAGYDLTGITHVLEVRDEVTGNAVNLSPTINQTGQRFEVALATTATASLTPTGRVTTSGHPQAYTYAIVQVKGSDRTTIITGNLHVNG